jgi:S1-C subfamily serine protease
MSIRVVCPSCDQVYNLDDDAQGKKVRCRNCQSPIQVPGAARQDRRDSRIGLPPPLPGSAVRPGREEAYEPPSRPAERSRGPRREEERGRASRLDRSRRENGGQGNNNLVLILAGVGVAAFVLLGLVAGGLFLIFGVKSGTSTPPTASSEPALAKSEQPDPPKGPPIPVVPIPEGPVPAEMAAAVVQKVKQATAYLRVNLPNGGVAEGSGFFALAPGIVITNAHVLGMLRADSLAPHKVDVVLRSGEPDESTVVGTVLGVDRDNDLAVLRVEGDAAGLPPPLPVDTATKLTETQKVYIFGFPFGAQLGKNITVSPSTITSLRRGDNGVLKRVQVNGGMHPGNSGGPVTDARGVVVGVSVAGIVGTQINFAIPGDVVTGVLSGKVTKAEMGFAYRSGDEVRLPIQVSCLDPLRRIRQLKVDVWTGPAGPALQASSVTPPARPGDSPRESFSLSARDGRYVGEVLLPRARVGQALWIQPLMVNEADASRWDSAVAVPAESQAPLDRQVALVQFKAPPGPIERTLRLNSQTTVTVFKGNSTLNLEDKLRGNVLEVLQPAPGKGTRVRLVFGDCPYSSRVGERMTEPPPEAHTILRRHSPTFILSPVHACVTATKHNFKDLRSVHRDAVNEMYQTICNTYEATVLPLPNRQVRPQESWPARMPMYVLRDGRMTIQDIFLTCTFEGTTDVAGRKEAYISLKGRVKGRGPRANMDLGKVSGHAQVDLDGGFVSQVKLTTITELENEGNDSRLLVHDESSVVRTEGNSLGLTPPPPGPLVQNQPNRPAPPPPNRPAPPPPNAPGSSLEKDLAALEGTWVSGDVPAEGGQGTGTIKLQLTPVAGRLGGQGKLEVATKRAGRTTTSSRTFSFTLSQKGDTRLLVAPGPRGTGLAFVYSFEDGQLILTGKVVSRRIGYSLGNVALRRESKTGVDIVRGNPAPGGGKGSPDAIRFSGDVFAFVGAAVQENRLTDVDIRGFQIGKDRYRDVPDEGGILIGFQVGEGKFFDKVVLKSWRPIFLTKKGEQFGKWQGAVPARPTTVKAKSGYVVSGMSVRTALGLDALTLTFARLGKDGLDLSDTYTSDTIGGTGGSPATIGGKGALFVGVTGHLSNDKSPCSLGLVAVVAKQ